MTRLDYFKEIYMPFTHILEAYTTREFTEITCREGGDVLVFRVYGNSEDGFRVSEK